MIDLVHGYSSHSWATTKPSNSSSLAEFPALPMGITDRADGGTSVHMDEADFAALKFDLSVVALMVLKVVQVLLLASTLLLLLLLLLLLDG